MKTDFLIRITADQELPDDEYYELQRRLREVITERCNHRVRFYDLDPWPGLADDLNWIDRVRKRELFDENGIKRLPEIPETCE